MKALILAGGKGTRLRPITFAIAKQLVPVANKPVIEYGIEAIVRAGIKEFGVIVGDTGPEVEARVGNGDRWGARVTYIPQPAPLGLAHAVQTAKPWLGDDDFIMYLGDNLIKSSIGELVEEFERAKPAASILLTPVSNPGDFGVAEMDGERVVRLEEKPAEPKSNLALVGVYLFDSRVHDSIAKLKPSARGELEITDAIQGLIEAGHDVRSHIVSGWWKDTGTVEAMLEANRLILEDQEEDVRGEIDGSTKIVGAVRIGVGTTVKNSVVHGPAIIGERCHIENSHIGPFTAIDSGSRIESSRLQDSIVMQDSVVRDFPRLIERSLIGRGAVVRGGSGGEGVSLVLGDQSEVTIL